MSKSLHQIFQNYLVKQGSRYTNQKKQIVTEILKTRRHFEIDAFLIKLNQKKKVFSRATVYRTVKQLLEANLIQKITTQEGKVFYEPCRQQKQHDHIICKNCGKIFEIKDTTIDSLIQSYCSDISFRPEYRSLHVYGLCSKCPSP
ncbi:MAG: transcriptional repressor [bacterium]